MLNRAGGAPRKENRGSRDSNSHSTTPQSEAKPEVARVGMEIDKSTVVDEGLARNEFGLERLYGGDTLPTSRYGNGI